MSHYDDHLSTSEKDGTVTTQDILLKLDELNAGLRDLQEMFEATGQDLKQIIQQLESMNMRLAKDQM